MHEFLSSINNAVALTQRLRAISKNIEDAEFKNVLAELSLEIADTKLALAQVTEENAQLKSELTKLKHSRGEIESDLIFKVFAYYSQSGDGPFCSGCYDTSQSKIRLSEIPKDFADLASHKCPSCGQFFGG
ncbi:hypothetical protein ACMZOO_00810 [Catenovulum sp. SX2]|uniref:hypothetical protein n=1 Tax=Catenovulum sp. SX2 TaxID=3398614 RepID=UPI003F872915